MENQSTVIVENVSKKFRLFNSPKERLFEAFHPLKKKYHKEFWALKNLNFEIKKGSTTGIIGRNGAGKSTLLQILCSILKPTSGTVTTNGIISPLLALGAGFNPEFTGRQNVLMNGALLGFSQEEMKKRLPEIEAFADIGDFIDQPMKIYSSGMSLRLTFAAAINVDPDILIVDEALAVGDAKFQHKCYGKFLEFQKSGKTIIFVSHDTNAVVKHCGFAILLEKGEIVEAGNPNFVVNCYHELIFSCSLVLSKRKTVLDNNFFAGKEKNTDIKPEKNLLDKFLDDIPATDVSIYRKNYNKNEYRFGDGRAEILDYLIVCGDNFDLDSVNSGDRIDIYSKVRFYRSIEFPIFSFGIKTVDGIIIYANNTWFGNIPVKPVKEMEIVIFCFSVKLNLISGDYFIGLDCSEMSDNKIVHIDRRSGVGHIKVREKNIFGGLVELDTVFREVGRKRLKEVLK